MRHSTKRLSGQSSAKRKSPNFTATPLHDRKKMVAEAAYYIAEQRGFQPGDELQDWLLAERQIDARLSAL